MHFITIFYHTQYIFYHIPLQQTRCGDRYTFNLFRTPMQRMLWVSGVHFTIHEFPFPLGGGCVSELECQYIANVCLTDGCPPHRKHSINHWWRNWKKLKVNWLSRSLQERKTFFLEQLQGVFFFFFIIAACYSSLVEDRRPIMKCNTIILKQKFLSGP